MYRKVAKLTILVLLFAYYRLRAQNIEQMISSKPVVLSGNFDISRSSPYLDRVSSNSDYIQKGIRNR